MLLTNLFIDLFNRFGYIKYEFELAKPRFYKFYSFFFIFFVYIYIPFLLILSPLTKDRDPTGTFLFGLIFIFLLLPVPGFNGDGVLPLFIYFFALAFFIAFWFLVIPYFLFIICRTFYRFFKSYRIDNGKRNVWADKHHRRPIGHRLRNYYDNDQYIHYEVILPSYFNQIKYYFNYLKSSNLFLVDNFKLNDQYSFYTIFLFRLYNWQNIEHTTLWKKFVDLANLRAQISKLYYLDKSDKNYFQERFLTTNLSIDQDIADARKYLQHLSTLKTKKEN